MVNANTFCKVNQRYLSQSNDKTGEKCSWQNDLKIRKKQSYYAQKFLVEMPKEKFSLSDYANQELVYCVLYVIERRPKNRDLGLQGRCSLISGFNLFTFF